MIGHNRTRDGGVRQMPAAGSTRGGARGAWLLALISVILLWLWAAPAAAAEVTLRMKGGGFEMSGRLISFDLSTYVIETPRLGRMSLKASIFDCVAGECPTGAVLPGSEPGRREAGAERPGQRAEPLPRELGGTTWIGGSAIGTKLVPALVESFANSIGATVSTGVGADPRDLTLTLADISGEQIGRIEVLRRGVPAGLDALAKGEAEVVWSGRQLSDAEIRELSGRGLPDLRTPDSQRLIAIDALVVLVAPANPAVALSLDQVARIFSGEISDWSQLGLREGPIQVYAPTEVMGTWSNFEEQVLVPRGLSLTPRAVRLEHATEWSDRVAADPKGIGIASVAYLRKARAINLELGCGLVARPSVFTTKTEEYPLRRGIYLYSNGRPDSALARALIDYAQSPAVQEALKAAEFVDLEPETATFADQGYRIAYALNAAVEDYNQTLMQSLIADIRGGERLSITFRFEPNSTVLTPASLDNVARLRSLIAGRYKGRRVALLGFSDTSGDFAVNLQLSNERAAAVERALLAAGPLPGVQLVTKGYGELAPVTCNETPEDRSTNRRVEVWLR